MDFLENVMEVEMDVSDFLVNVMKTQLNVIDVELDVMDFLFDLVSSTIIIDDVVQKVVNYNRNLVSEKVKPHGVILINDVCGNEGHEINEGAMYRLNNKLQTISNLLVPTTE